MARSGKEKVMDYCTHTQSRNALVSSSLREDEGALSVVEALRIYIICAFVAMYLFHFVYFVVACRLSPLALGNCALQVPA